MFGIGDTELVLIVLFGFLLFGPDKLPGMGRTVGRALRQFRNAQEGVNKVVRAEIIDPMQKAADGSEEKPKATDEDADLPEVDATSKPKETFAERRARLAKEKADGSAGTAPAAQEDDAADKADEAGAASQPAESEASAEPDPTSLEALYGLAEDEESEPTDAASADKAEANADLDAGAPAVDSATDKEVRPCQ